MGDMGDVLYLCPCMKLVAEQSGEPITLYAKNGLRLHDFFTDRIPLLAPLLESQDYIETVLPYNSEHIDYDACLFRDDGLPFGETLAARQADWLKLSPDFSVRWLDVTPDRQATIVINRSARYRNPFFPWEELVATFGKDMLFIGLPSEYWDFCLSFGEVEYLHTKNLLEAARTIAGSELFIGNQSSCNAIAEGLKHNLIQETDTSSPDCIYPRVNAIHCHNGALDLTFHGEHFTSTDKLFARAHFNETPPGGWQAKINGYQVSSYSFDHVLTGITSKLQTAGMEIPETSRR